MVHFKPARLLATLAFFAACTGAANATTIQITEWMYQGTNGEFVEFTNLGATAISMSGWSYSDSGRQAGHVDLSAFGLVQAGESVLLTETAVAAFRSAWGLSATTKVIGGNSTDNLGRSDEINIYDAGGALVDRLTFGDQDFPGSPRTANKSTSIPFADLSSATAKATWSLAATGDSFGSHASTGGDIGNPGQYPAPVPLPAAAVLLLSGLGFFGPALRRRRN